MSHFTHHEYLRVLVKSMLAGIGLVAAVVVLADPYTDIGSPTPSRSPGRSRES